MTGFDVTNRSFKKGDKVKLGNGDKGTIVSKEERQGFTGYRVKITDSVDENSIGRTVGASPAGMQKVSSKLASVSVNGIEVLCEIASTPSEQSMGLQGHEGLEDGMGMLFPYHPPRSVRFHMASVKFPIDIIFINDKKKISKIVENIQPGAIDSWGIDKCSMVVEVPGGFCRRNNIRPKLGFGSGSKSYDLLRTITEASEEDEDDCEKEAKPNPLQPGYHSVKPMDFSDPPGEYHPNIDGNRFKDRDFGERGNPNANQMSVKYWSDSSGYDVRDPTQELGPQINDGEGRPLRPSANLDSPDLASVTASIIAVMLESGDLKWNRDYTTDRMGQDQATITPEDIERWVQDPKFQEYFVDSLVAGGVADQAEASGGNFFLRRKTKSEMP
jgi:uncharacterized membrane protein (UPF0127 family)